MLGVEEIVKLLLQDVRKCEELGMHVQANQMCGMGLLLGLYRFERGSKSEFTEWAGDALLVSVKAVIDT